MQSRSKSQLEGAADFFADAERKTPRAQSCSTGDARLILDEICAIMTIPNNDPVMLLETVRKLERVVKAVPRMEGFI